MTIFNNIFIIGLGLIGGSFARALKKYNSQQIIGAYDKNYDNLSLAKLQKTIDYTIDLQANKTSISDIDLIVISTPLSTYNQIFRQINHIISKNTIVIDLGSVKNFAIPKNIKNFIPCHPIAGLHQSGFEYSDEKLFDNKQIIICRDQQKLKDDRILSLFKSLNLKYCFMDSVKHDKIYALISHLPQFLSFLFLDLTPKDLNINDSFYKSFRLNKSNPEIWADVFKLNEVNIGNYYIDFFDNLKNNIDNINNCAVILDKINFYHKKYDNLLEKSVVDEKFFCYNFKSIFFRVLMVISYLEIKEIEDLKEYYGNGFKDFISILNIFNLNQEILISEMKKSQNSLQEIFKELN